MNFIILTQITVQLWDTSISFSNDQVCKSNTLNKQWRTRVGPPIWVVSEVLTNPYLTNWPPYETDTCESGQE